MSPVTKVPTPRDRERQALILAACLIVFAVGLGGGAAAYVMWGRSPWVPLGWAALAAIVLFLLALLLLRGTRQARGRYLPEDYWLDDEEKRASANVHPVACFLKNKWQAHELPPVGLRLVKQAIERYGLHPSRSARIVYLSRLQPPAPADNRFEPVIITPARMFSPYKRFVLAVNLFFVVACFVLHAFGALGGGGIVYRVLMAPLAGAAVGGCLVAVIWGILFTWRSVLRPRYIRLAPGVVQVMQYNWLGLGRPTIRSYTMDAGTLVIVSQADAVVAQADVNWDAVPTWRRSQVALRTLGRVRVILSRGKMKDTIDFTNMHDPTDALTSIWQAILSTAPTPRLSDTELVG